MTAPLPPTTVSDAELVAEWRAAMEGVTPGPWRPSRFGFQVVSDYPEPAWQSVVELKTIARSEPNAEREMLTQQAIANWIARCSPSGIASLLDRLDKLSAEVAAKDAVIAEAKKLADRYGVALMMIRAGCSDPQRFAGRILDDDKPIDIDLEDLS